MRVPTSLDDRINYLVEAIDPEIRIELLNQLRTLRAAGNPAGVVEGMYRPSLKLFRLIYQDVGEPWPKGDNLWNVIARLAIGFEENGKKVPGLGILPKELYFEMETVRTLSNHTHHGIENFPMGVAEAEVVLNCFLSLLNWYYVHSRLTPPLVAISSFGPEVPAIPGRPLPPLDEHTLSSIPDFDSTFVGRVVEIEQLRYLLIDQAKGIVTLTGTGGIGKSRFACEVARRLLPHFPGGAHFIELKEHETVAGICVAVADAFQLNLDQADDPARVIGNVLKAFRKPTLLVFDNFEHLATLARATIGDWRSKARAVQFLVTSRVSLGLSGEQLFPLPSLVLPPFTAFPGDLAAIAANESVQLFCQTASARGRSFELRPENAWHVMEVCRLLQGQPLPIILVAKRARFRPIQDLAEDLWDRPLDSIHADGEALRETIDWSYQLLSPVEQDVFRQICIFRDGFTSDAAERVIKVGEGPTRPVLEHVERLCDFSLIECEPVSDGRMRFALFQTILDFGRGSWPEGHDQPPADLARRWADHYLTYAEKASSLVSKPDCTVGLRQLVEERENILASHRWALKNGEGELATRLILADSPALRFSGPWQVREQLFRETIEVLGEAGDPRLRVLIRIELSDALWSTGDGSGAFALATETLAIARTQAETDPFLLAEALNEVAKRAENVGDHSLAMTYHDEGRQISLGIGDERMVALHEAGLASLLDRQGRYDEARSLVRLAVARLETFGDRIALAWAVNRLGLIVWHEGSDAEALELFRRAEHLFREIEYPRWYAGTITNQGLALNELERFDEAISCFQDAGEIHNGQGNRAWWAVNQAGLGTTHLLQGEIAEALETFTEALLVSEESGYLENQALLQGLLGRSRLALGEFAEAERHFRRAVAFEDQMKTRDRRYFGNLVNLAWVLESLGRPDEASPLIATADLLAARLGLTENHPIRMVRQDVTRARELRDRGPR